MTEPINVNPFSPVSPNRLLPNKTANKRIDIPKKPEKTIDRLLWDLNPIDRANTLTGIANTKIK